MKQVTDELTDEAVKLFAEAFDKLHPAVEQKQPSRSTAMDPAPCCGLPAPLNRRCKRPSNDWQAGTKCAACGRAMLRSGPATMKASGSAGSASPKISLRICSNLSARRRRQECRLHTCFAAGYGWLQPLSRGPEDDFRKSDGYPELHVLDSTDPAQVKTFENKVDLAKTLFIVSSKSGSTLEPNIFKQYFFDACKQVVGERQSGQPLHRHHRSRIEDAAGS